MRRFFSLCLSAALLSLLVAGHAVSAPSTISYQGRLTNSAGTPVADGSYAVTFSIWTDSVAGSMIWSESQNIQVSGGGLFATQLGGLQPLGGDLISHSSDDLYLQASVAGTPLLPRLAVGSVPHAVISSSLNHSVPGVGSMHMSVGTDTTKISSSHESATGIIDSYIHITDDRALMGLKAYDPVHSSQSSYSSRVSADSSRNYLDYDDDADGIPEQEISSAIVPTRAQHAVNTKGTGAQSGRVVSVTSGTDVDSASLDLSTDDDGDGIAEAKVKLAAGASLLGSALPGGAIVSALYDSDDDGTPEQEISSAISPTTAKHAVNTKGTGAQSGRSVSVSSGTVVDSALHEVSLDDDGDGLPENYISERVKKDDSKVTICHSTASATNVFGVTVSADSTDMSLTQSDPSGESSMAAKGHNIRKDIQVTLRRHNSVSSRETSISADTASTGMQCLSDSDNDGLTENEASLMVTPTTSAVAIKTKGTGADANRVVIFGGQTDVSGASHHLELDDDGDGTPESSLREAATPSVSEVVVTKHQDVSSASIRVAATLDSAVIDLGYHGSTTGTIRIQAGSSGTANPIEHSSGAHLTPGGVWTNASDENLKENFQTVDGADLLEKIEQLPISEWNYKNETDDTKHIGPTAQDFQKIFGVGSDGKSISTIDPSGIALAAIKELNKKLEQENMALRAEMNELKKLVQQLASQK